MKFSVYRLVAARKSPQENFQVPERRWLFIAFLPVVYSRVGTFVDFRCGGLEAVAN